jgi:choline dehydrogenase-like flavoprotein
MKLPPRRHEALQALCARMVPLDDPAAAATLAGAVLARLDGGDAAQAAQVSALLGIFAHRAAALLTGGGPGRFARLSPERQDAWLARWESSRIPLCRTVFQALRRLVISTWYGDAQAQREIGYLGPLHDREPAFPWEGAMQGEGGDAGPIAVVRPGERRVPLTGGARVLPVGVYEGADLGADTHVKAGVCVVGTGAGGAVAAARLAAGGHDVVLLEEGGWWHPADFDEVERSMTPSLYADRGMRATDDLAVPMFQGRSVGGGTTVNWLIMLHTPPWVLDEWAHEHGTEGMGAAEMAAVFERIERETSARPVPDEAHNPPNRILLDGARALGWSASAGTVNAHGCVRSGMCGLGCRYGARRGPSAVYIPQALADGARLYADVRADRVEVVGRGGAAPLKRVHATVLDRATGAARGRLTVEAPIVVLAGGAVGTPALLQRSGMGGGGVGSYLRLHPTTAVIARYGRTLYGGGGIPLSSVCDEFLRGGDGYGFWIECPPLYPALASVAVQGFGERHRAVMREYPRLGSLVVLVRDGADRLRSSGSVRVDRRGKVRISYTLGPAEKERIAEGITAAARIHLAAGAEEVRTLHARETVMRSEAELDVIARRNHGANHLGVLSAHVNGTCRMGRDPRTSGVDPAGQRHGVPGLYVVDGSVLPTAPGVNPQETIMAVATVLAERLAAAHPAG